MGGGLDTTSQPTSRKYLGVLILLFGCGLIAFMAICYALVVYKLATTPMWRPDSNNALVSAERYSTFVQYQTNVAYGCWYLAQFWLLKLSDHLSIESLKLMSSVWAMIGLLVGIILGRCIWKLGIFSIAVFVLLFITSDGIRVLAGTAFSAYIASITLGGASSICLVLLFRHRCCIQAWLAGVSLLCFAITTLYSPPAAMLIGAGLAIICGWMFVTNGIRRGISLLWLCFLIGLPSLLVMIPFIVLYPHHQFGAPAGYSSSLFLTQPQAFEDQIGFIVSRSIKLGGSIMDPNHRLLVGGWSTVWVVVGMALATLGVMMPWRRGGNVEYRFAGILLVASLIPIAILGALGWYPYGDAKYESYVVILCLVFAAVGVDQLSQVSSVSALGGGWFKPCAQLVSFVAVCCLIFLIAWSGTRMVTNEDTRRRNYTTSLEQFQSTWSQLTPNSVVVSYDAMKILWCIGIPTNDLLFVIPLDGRMHRTETLDSFKSALESRDSIGLYCYRPLHWKPFDPYMLILNELGFKQTARTPGHWCLRTWERTQSD